MLGIAQTARNKGIVCYTACPDGRSMRRNVPQDHIFIGSRPGRNLHLVLSGITGLNGCFSLMDTWRFLRKLDEIGPEIVHLHNLHNGYINLPMLFHWLKKRKVRIVWTLHDCWAFTGKCPYYDAIGCWKWKSGCHHCPQLSQYPQSLADITAHMWRWKRNWFVGLDDLTIVTPSDWLASQVKASFLGKYPVCVIPNGIDCEVFCKRESDLRKRYQLEQKRVILGVAGVWDETKGLNTFCALAPRLKPDEKIVLLGLTPEQQRRIPEGILALGWTQSQEELAQWYSVADVYVNTSIQETMGMTTVEAAACGTPVVVMDATASPETAKIFHGSVVSPGDLDGLLRAIRNCAPVPNVFMGSSNEQMAERYCGLYQPKSKEMEEANPDA